MDQIDQLYCTHCTYGTSALHRNSSAIKDQVFEYSTRAGSVEQAKAHDCFRSVESAMFFHLPGDAPASEMLKLDAHSARWRRLVYHPSIGGQRMLAHICYRQKDTRGRPGSYFAHVLLSAPGADGAGWRLTDCLKLWNTDAWRVAEPGAESGELSYDLPAVANLEAFGAEHRTSINDDLLFNFLTKATDPYPPRPPVKPGFHDFGCLIPARWWTRPPAERQKLFIDMLRATLELDLDKQERLLIAVEPGVAALLFYGIGRLLPAKGFAERLSFSTFESHLDRPTTVLTAFDFHNPEATDFYPDAYRTRGFVFNTYRRRPALQFRNADGAYAQFIVGQLVAKGMAAAEEIVEQMSDAGAVTPADLELLVKAHGIAASILDPNFTHAPDLSQMTPLAVAYLRRRLTAEITRAPDTLMAELAGGPAYLPLLDLVGGNGQPSGRGNPVIRLIQVMPKSEDVRNRMLGLPNLLPEYKARWLDAYIRHTGAWPRKYPNLWTTSSMRPGGLIQALLERLSPELVTAATASLAPDKLGPFVSLLGLAAAKDPGKFELLAGLVHHLDEDSFCAVLSGPEQQARQFLQSFAPNDSNISKRLQKLLEGILEQPQAFRDRLTALYAARSHLSQRDQDRIYPLVRLRDAIVELAKAPEPKKSLLGKASLEEWQAAGQKLKLAIRETIPDPESMISTGSLLQLKTLKSLASSLLDKLSAATFNVRASRLLMPPAIDAFADDLKLCRFLASKEGADWVKLYPVEEPALGERMAKVLEELPEPADEFEVRVGALMAIRKFLPGENACIMACDRVLEILRELREMRRKVVDAGELKGERLEQAARGLAEIVGVAFRNKIQYDPKTKQVANKRLLDNLGLAILQDNTLNECRQVWPMISHYMTRATRR